MARAVWAAASMLVAATLVSGPASAETPTEDQFAAMRDEMVTIIEEQTDFLRPEIGDVELSESVLEALRTVPRHEFVPDDLKPFAYLDTPLPVGEGATVSQPFITAFMLHLLDISEEDEVLQAAVGGGYEAALLAELSQSVHSMEFNESVTELAEETLERLGYSIDLRSGDIYYGWPERRQFDAIIVRMAMPYVPTPLVQQLRRGGRMVVPVGPEDGPQDLVLITKNADGDVSKSNRMSVRFQTLPGGMRL